MFAQFYGFFDFSSIATCNITPGERKSANITPSVHLDIIKGKIYATFCSVRKFLFNSSEGRQSSTKRPFSHGVKSSPSCSFSGCSWQWNSKEFSFLLALVKGEYKRVNFYVIIKCNIDTRSFMLKTLQQHLQQTNTGEHTTRHNRWGYGKCFQFFGVHRTYALV